MPRRLLILALATAMAWPQAGASAATAPHCAADLDHRLSTAARAHRGVSITVAVRDLTDGLEYGYRRHVEQRTASTVKLEILETLLHRYRHGLPTALRSTATGMIERSDNGDAQALYRKAGGAKGLRAFGAVAGLRETRPAAAHGPGYAWGLTLTSPADQVRLLALLVAPNAVLADPGRRYALGLMSHVVPGQRWGVSSGVGKDHVALKNGWLPLHDGTSDWQVNSIGVVWGHTRHYLIAIESHGAATMRRGVATVESISRVVARACP